MGCVKGVCAIMLEVSGQLHMMGGLKLAGEGQSSTWLPCTVSVAGWSRLPNLTNDPTLTLFSRGEVVKSQMPCRHLLYMQNIC